MKRIHAPVIALCKTALLMMVLSSCPAPWNGDEGTITIAFGPSGRIPVTIEQMNVMAHEIILSGPYDETIVHEFAGPGPIAITVAPGIWTIRTRTVGSRGGYGAPFPEQMLRALGFGDEPIEVVAGEDTVARITVISAAEVATNEQLSVAISLARTDNREKIIVITGDIEIANTHSIAAGRNITLTSDIDVKIRRAVGFTGPVFHEDGGTITIGDRITMPYPGYVPGDFSISFADFQNMPQNAAISGPNVGILAASTTFSVVAPPGYAFDGIRWLFDGQVRSTGASFGFTREMHGMRLGTHIVTLEVEIDGWWFSRIVNVTVVP